MREQPDQKIIFIIITIGLVFVVGALLLLQVSLSSNKTSNDIVKQSSNQESKTVSPYPTKAPAEKITIEPTVQKPTGFVKVGSIEIVSSPTPTTVPKISPTRVPTIKPKAASTPTRAPTVRPTTGPTNTPVPTVQLNFNLMQSDTVIDTHGK